MNELEEYKKLGMGEKELRARAICSSCNNPIAHAGPQFYALKVDSHMLNLRAIERQQGLGMMLGGNGLLAYHMGPDEKMTFRMASKEIVLCQNCMMNMGTLCSHISE